MSTAEAHVPVMRDRVLELLAPALELPGAVLVDATLGRAGHASALLAAHPGLILIGIDTDVTAISESHKVLAPFSDRVTLVQAVYDELAGHPGRRRAYRGPGHPVRPRHPRRNWTTPTAGSPTF